MGQRARFLMILLLGLAVLSTGAYQVALSTTRRWFERDIVLRSRLVLNTGRRSLVDFWNADDRDALSALLRNVTRDERIMAAGACVEGGEALAQTADFPRGLTCRAVASRRGPRPSEPPGEPWFFVRPLGAGSVHVSALPVMDQDRELGFVVLVHDLGFVGRREAEATRLLLGALFALALGAAVLTVVAAKLARRDWLQEVRQSLRAGGRAPEYQALMRDVRELAAELAREGDPDARGGRWSPGRLKAVLGENLHGERVIIVANREPYIHQRAADGGVTVQHPASGLVTALEPVMRACSGVWVAHGSGSADRETVDASDHVMVPPGEESYSLRRVWLTPEEEKGYYYGFANEGLWALCHVAHARPEFRASDWEHYRAVNQKFADAVCDEVEGDDPIVLVQDYHFALAPRMIRERLPKATIITFWHIPWPSAERFGICPWREELLDGLLGSSVVGFHTQQHCNNYLDSVDAFVECRIDREQNAVVRSRRSTLVRPYPISIEWPVHWLDGLPSAAQCHAAVRAELGLRPDALLGVGIDRLDYTKGIEERLLAVERLLERFPEYVGRFVFAQLAAPSRTTIPAYRALNETVERVAARINERFGSDGYEPIKLLRAHHEPPTVYRYYRAAELCYVSSLHDGMNLVAKEFVSARGDELGVLVLSCFTGAARELTEALIVNPYDLEEASSALAAALRMPADEQRERMHSMRSLLAEFNVYRWAGRMLTDAAGLRRKERVTGRLSGWPRKRSAR